MGEFGNKFRKAREKKQISFDDVSKVLKISARMLRAIEEENFDQLPGGVFNKGFIRSYAKHLDLDPEDAINDYLATQQVNIDSQETWEAQSRVPAQSTNGKLRVAGSEKPASKSGSAVGLEELPDLQLPRVEDIHRSRKQFLDRTHDGLSWQLIVAAIVVIALAAFLWIRHFRASRATSTPPRAAAAQPASPVAMPAASTQPRAPSLKKTAPELRTSMPQAKVTAGSQIASPIRAADTEATTAQPGKNLLATSKSSEKTAAALSLVIRASESSWISVQADGQQVIEETLIAPAHTAVRANREIIVKVGNAAGVTFVFNGTEVSPQGAESEVKTLVFDPSGMKLPP